MGIETFKSRVDWWMGAALAAIPVVCVVVLAGGLRSGDTGEVWGGIVTSAVALAIFGLLVFPMRYELHDTELVIRFGVVRSRIPYTKIRGVKRTRNPISSPALSLRRLHIDAGSSIGPNISPPDRKAFMKALARRAPHLVFDGDRLVSR